MACKGSGVRAPSAPPFSTHIGAWRSLVARPVWVRKVASSNPAAPTIIRITSSPDGPTWAAPARGGAVRSARVAHTHQVVSSNLTRATIRDETVRTVNRPAQRASAARPS